MKNESATEVKSSFDILVSNSSYTIKERAWLVDRVRKMMVNARIKGVKRAYSRVLKEVFGANPWKGCGK